MTIGVGYTVVATSDGGIGLCYTYLGKKISCSMVADFKDPEGRPGTDLLEKILSPDPLHRGMALALINALNHADCLTIAVDSGNKTLFSALDIGPGRKIAMVGGIAPLVRDMEARGAVVEVLDEFKEIGESRAFTEKLLHWADGALLTSTTLLNGTTESLINAMGDQTKVVLVGPSTPMCFEPFDHLPVCGLAGLVPVDKNGIIKAIRHGAGTRDLHSYSKKIVLAG